MIILLVYPSVYVIAIEDENHSLICLSLRKESDYTVSVPFCICYSDRGVILTPSYAFLCERRVIILLVYPSVYVIAIEA